MSAADTITQEKIAECSHPLASSDIYMVYMFWEAARSTISLEANKDWVVMPAELKTEVNTVYKIINGEGGIRHGLDPVRL